MDTIKWRKAMNTTRTFGPTNTKFFDSYETWVKEIKDKGLSSILVQGGVSAQDAMGTCRGYWAYVVKKGWIEFTNH
jgi:hypothetical protein